jgi:hypothetical protein
MKLYIVTLFDSNHLGDQIIKVFSTKEHLDRWLECAKQMDQELFGNVGRDVTQNYKIKYAELDNLDFIELLAEAKHLGAQIKSSEPP